MDGLPPAARQPDPHGVAGLRVRDPGGPRGQVIFTSIVNTDLLIGQLISMLTSAWQTDLNIDLCLAN